MKNLRIENVRIHSLVDLPTSEEPLSPVDICPIPSPGGSGNDFVILSKNGSVFRISPSSSGRCIWSTDLRKVSNLGGTDEWINLSLVETNTVAAISSKGAIVSISLSGEAELVGEFEGGIFAGSWSPDGEILAIVTAVEEETRRYVLLCMNAHWDMLSEVDIPACDQTEPVHLSWRPDASLLAVSSVDSCDKQRKVRIYERDSLSLHAIGRMEDGSGALAPNLTGPMSWAGSGCSLLLTTIQRKGKKHQVSLLESNGLRHGQFALCHSDMVVTSLSWNVDSDILVVCLRCPTSQMDSVQLWHRCNYHWYLKQEILIKQARLVKFHPERASTLLVLESTQCREYHVRWDPSTIGLNATAFVIDGSELNMTALESAIVPPPMHGATIALPRTIAQVLPTRIEHPTIAVVVHSDGSFSWIEKVDATGNHTITRVSEWGACNGLDPMHFYEYCIVCGRDAELNLVAVSSLIGGPPLLVEISLSKSHAQVIATIPLENHLLNVSSWLDTTDGALIQLENGQLLEYCFPGSLAPSEAEPLLEPCPWLAAVRNAEMFADGSGSLRTRMVFGLSSRSRLYCGELLLADAATSFFVSTMHEYLCFASSDTSCQLRFLSLIELYSFDPFLGSDENFVRQGYEPRTVERGAKLVAVLPNRPALVVQMPRGNLETIHPRALLLRHAVHQIDEGNYATAFAILRRHRVNLNLLIDINPDKFLEERNSHLFLDQMVSIDHLNLFISSLQDADSTKSHVYIPSWWRRDGRHHASLNGQEFDFSTKVNRTCQLLRSTMLETEANGKTLSGRAISRGHFLLPILSTFAKETPPQLESALLMIKKNAESKRQITSRKKPPLFSDAAQRSIQYLAFLANYEMLFESALSVYEFDVARAVARNSQMDPKTYLPMLKRFRELPDNFARYEVDMRLKRYDSALRHLCTSMQEGEQVPCAAPTDPALDENKLKLNGSNDFDTCLALIKRESLYRLGLQLFREEPQRSRIMLSLGDFLLEQRDPASALSIFLACAPEVDVERATRAARQSMDWRAFFSLTASTDHGASRAAATQNLSLLARQVADELVAAAVGNYARRQLLTDAARVLLDYGQEEVAAAVDILIVGELWNEGRRTALRASRNDLVRRCVDAAVTYAHTAVADLQERNDSFRSNILRYAEALRIRGEALERGDDLGDGTTKGEDDDEAGSVFSLASHASNLSERSGTSTGSVRSNLSSVISVRSSTSFGISGNEERNRHKSKFNTVGDRRSKQKKKSRRGRSKIAPGSAQDLHDLLVALRSSCINESYRDALAETITFLFQNDHMSLAKTLYDTYVNLGNSIDQCQAQRRAQEEEERMQREMLARREGINRPPYARLGVEDEVNALACIALPEELHRLFSFLPDDL